MTTTTATIHGALPTTTAGIDNVASLIGEAIHGSDRVMECGCEAPFCWCDVCPDPDNCDGSCI